MKFTLSWLKQHLDTDAGLDAIATKLTALGLEVEGVEDRGAVLKPFVVGHVKSAEKHPDADKLRVCMVDVGQGAEVQVVCGAPNARAGLKTVFAAPGTTIPGNGMELKIGAIRGVESRGMLCSAREMGLGEEHDGIMELPADAPVGRPFAEVLGLDDPLIEINLTPDRADCAGVRGIARDLAAAGLGKLKPLPDEKVAGAYASPISVAIESEAREACPLFLGRHFRGVRNGPSPQWLQDRLRSIGLRPISALVDVTNFFTFDLARPLHVFDAAKVKGGLTVRFARAGEKLAALNGQIYELTPDMTVIAAGDEVESLGGVMGGEATGVVEETTEVFLEVALFDPTRTALTGRKLGVISDARYRFERGVDPAFAPQAMELATRMILDLCGGEASEVVVAGAVPEWRRELTLRADRVRSLGGLDVPADRQADILRDLGFELRGGEPIVVTPPSWRPDVHGEADLIEEVLRVVGYDEIPAVPMERLTAVTRPALDAGQRRRNFARRALAARGLDEAVTWSFMDSRLAGLFGQTPPSLRLLNPIAADLDQMRPSVLPNLIMAAARNAARGYPDVGVFEIGPMFVDATDKGQILVAAGLRAGLATPRHWAAESRSVDLFDAKADAVAALEAAGAPTGNLQTTRDAPDWYHPGRSGVLRLGANVLARFGEAHPAVLEALDAKGPLVMFEVFLDAIPQPKSKPGKARAKLELAALQPVTRDFAFLVDRGIEADKLVRAARGADKKLIADVALFDVYEGKGVPDGQKSLAIEVTLQPTERALTEAEIDALSTRVVDSVAKATGGMLRG